MQIRAVDGIPEIRPGDDLAAAIGREADLDADVLCVASTVVAKATGRYADLADYEPSDRARSIADRIDRADPRFIEAVIQESEEIVLEDPFVLAVTPFGHVGVNAGIDRSNAPGGDILLLPEAPGEHAAALRDSLAAEGFEGGVIVTDTSGRPFRAGQRGVALGWAGLPACRDYRGEHDREGHELEATVEAVVDELSAAANLVMGEADAGRPAATIHGFEFGDHDESDRLFRDRETDFVRQALATFDVDSQR
ncbi:coenzyme F420-0:L-glutamate ligase [Halococcoides cellulosivorans]|uniref:Coenzyme F420-0:L-glutamate ligase n=1 Tax=Halococcoides cellulosivorans TaxID=1679096 RepID=A0A2R4X088_9EURY|nr:coenzyme F420-0:L-glutamate ligase [Halococcoides cellulosivorans]AWB27218.1 coenzyme F420-0:L-glutamate ligase [Halococcoides cellulosivorans]